MQSLGLVYLIDDDEIQNIINTRIFELIQPGLLVKAFLDAGNAIDELTSTTHLPDLIFLDLNMPTTSGWEFLDRFERLKFEIPLIILTSSINGGDRERAEQYPAVVRYVSKPVSKQFMNELISELLK